MLDGHSELMRPGVCSRRLTSETDFRTLCHHVGRRAWARA